MPTPMPATADIAPTPPACLVCGNAAGNRILAAREKMDGTLESFDYVQCAACGHLHLVAPPADLGSYYAKGYYSFHARAIPCWRQWLYRTRTASLLGNGHFLGRLLNGLKPPYYAYWLAQTGLRRGDRAQPRVYSSRFHCLLSTDTLKVGPPQVEPPRSRRIDIHLL